jgi:hypothetical protein
VFHAFHGGWRDDECNDYFNCFDIFYDVDYPFCDVLECCDYCLGPGGVCCEVSFCLDEDHCPGNDTLSRVMMALWSHDIAVKEITSPKKNCVTYGDCMDIEADVCNYGYHDEEDVPVIAQIFEGSECPWVSTKYVDLPSQPCDCDDPWQDNCMVVDFGEWCANKPELRGTYVELVVTSHLPNDDYNKNNSRSKKIWIGYENNMAAVDISSPEDAWIPRGESITLKGVFMNQSCATMSGIAVECVITDHGTTIYEGTGTISTIGAFEYSEVSFDPAFDVPDVQDATYEMTIKVVPADDNPDDDEYTRTLRVGIADSKTDLPKVFALNAVQPNPFVSETQVRYQLPAASFVSLKVYDITGKLVRTLVSETEDAGFRSIVWNGTDDAGRKVAKGVYLISFDTPEYSTTRKLVLMTR